MKTLKTLSLGLTMTLIAGCNSGGGSSSGVSSTVVTTGLTMTGSGQSAVARADWQKTLSFFIPSAYALTPPPLFDSNNSSVSLNEAWIVIKEIEFEAEEVDDGSENDEDEVEFEGPFFVDLLSDSPESFGDAVIPATGLKRVKMKLHEAESIPANVPSELSSKSIYLSGAVNGFAFTYAADDSTEFEISGPNAIFPNSSQDLLIVIRIADLFSKIDLSSINAQTDIHAGNRVNAADPCPLIDPEATDLYTCFRKGLSSESSFGKDDGDNDLDEDDETVDDDENNDD